METYNDIRCIDALGNVKFIPEHLVNNRSFMQRHHLHEAPIKTVPEVKGDLILEIETEPTEEIPEISEQEAGITKEQLWELLDAKGITYKKTMGITKLTELLNQ